VTHDRYLAQKIATHLMYIEDGRAVTFDRLAAFEDWLDEGRPALDASTPPTVSVRPAEPSATGSGAAMSKNRRDKLQNEVRQIESAITGLEAELKQLETEFANPGPDVHWETAQRRHAEIQQSLETLYADLAERWEQIEG
jgi:hypothetical protein